MDFILVMPLILLPQACRGRAVRLVQREAGSKPSTAQRWMPGWWTWMRVRPAVPTTTLDVQVLSGGRTTVTAGHQMRSESM